MITRSVSLSCELVDAVSDSRCGAVGLADLDQVPRDEQEGVKYLFAFCRAAREEDDEDGDDAEAGQDLWTFGTHASEL